LSVYQEEVTYADLAMELGPRQAIPKYNQPPQETLYAAVGTAWILFQHLHKNVHNLLVFKYLLAPMLGWI